MKRALLSIAVLGCAGRSLRAQEAIPLTGDVSLGFGGGAGGSYHDRVGPAAALMLVPKHASPFIVGFAFGVQGIHPTAITSSLPSQGSCSKRRYSPHTAP